MTDPDCAFDGDSYENRTRVSAVRGRRLSRLTKEPFFRRFDIIPLSNSHVNSFFKKNRQMSPNARKIFYFRESSFSGNGAAVQKRRKHGHVSWRRPSPQLPFIDKIRKETVRITNRPFPDHMPSALAGHIGFRRTRLVLKINQNALLRKMTAAASEMTATIEMRATVASPVCGTGSV